MSENKQEATNKANKKLNEEFYGDDQENILNVPIFSSNNTPSIQVNKNKKD